MGKLVDGTWTTDWYEPDEDGAFVRPDTVFRSRIETSPDADFTAAPDRYHLYISLACPWAHRVNAVRAALGLHDVLPITVVSPRMGDEGWTFQGDQADDDHVNGAEFLRDVYLKADPNYTGRVTVPVLWDKERKTIVNNESREIVRMLTTSMRHLGSQDVTLYTDERQAAIDDAIDAIYEPINNGVYRAGFATSQSAYDTAVGELFEALDHWEGVLSNQAFLAGNAVTEADICLFTTLIRFDAVYHGHFKCNRKRIVDYPSLSRVMRAVYDLPGVADTVNMAHITEHYYWSHTSINPTRIVPTGPATLWRDDVA